VCCWCTVTPPHLLKCDCWANIFAHGGFTVAGPLLPGHGTTPQDANRAHWQDWVKAVEASYRQLVARCDTVLLGGESMVGCWHSTWLLSTRRSPAYWPMPRIDHRARLRPLPVGAAGAFHPFSGEISDPPTLADERWQGYPGPPAASGWAALSLAARRAPPPAAHPPTSLDRAGTAGHRGASLCAG